MAIEYFCCYHSYLQKVAKLSDQELGRLFRALLVYSSTGERAQLAGREDIAFDFIADDIDRAKKAYEKRCAANSDNGKMGGRPKKQTGFDKSEKSDGFSKNQTVFQETEKSQTKDKTKGKNKEEKGKSDAADGNAGRARPSPAKFSPEDHAYQAAVYLDRQIQARLEGQKSVGEKRLQAWALEFDRCHRLDEHSWEDIGQVLRFSQKDPFWQSNILSGKAFREKYVQLLAKMRASPDEAAKRAPPGFPDYGDKEEYL